MKRGSSIRCRDSTKWPNASRTWRRSRRPGRGIGSGTSRMATPAGARPRTGKPATKIIADVRTLDPQCIRPITEPHSARGSLCVLFGNPAPDGAVIKIGAVEHHELTFRGPARVFEDEESAIAAVRVNGIRSGEVVVVRAEGPRGGPGMREIL